MNILILIVMLSVILLIMRYEKEITPFGVLSIPFFLVASISLISSRYLSFTKTDPFILFLWLICIIVFWFGGKFGQGILLPIRKFKRRDNLKKKYKVLVIISTVLSLLLLFNAIRVASTLSDPILISTDQYSTEIVKGPYEWIRTLCMIFFIFLLGNIDSERKLFILPIITICMNLLIFQIKGMILMPVLAALFYRIIEGKLKFQKRTWLFLFLLGIIIFYLVYAIPYLVSDQLNFILSREFVNFVINHIVAFLNAGVLGFSAKNMSGIIISRFQRWQIIAPIMNILRRFTSWPRYSVMNLEMLINSKDGITSNVGTMFGTFYLHTNIVCTLLFAFLLGIFAYYLMSLSKRSNNIWHKTMYCHLLSILAFGWFEYYFWHQYIITMFVFLSIFSFFSKVKL